MTSSEFSEIAVVIVCMNMLDALRKTVSTTLALSDPRVCIYVVDGASKDGTRDYLRTLPEQTVRWTSENDKGIYEAMNKGWNMVPDSAYVLYLGAGDTITSLPPPDAVQIALANQHQVIIGACYIGERQFTSGWSPTLRWSNTAHHQALLVHKSVCPKSPFDESMRVYGDWEFNIRLFKDGVKAMHVGGFVTFAEPGGVSARHDLPEIWRIAYRHGGLKVACHSFLKNCKAELKNRLGAASA